MKAMTDPAAPGHAAALVAILGAAGPRSRSIRPLPPPR
jgi:hypothetical protein